MYELPQGWCVVKYRTIVADPPWEYEGFASSPGSHGKWTKGVISTGTGYPMMPVADISALPVADMAEPDCRLFMWTTSRYLPESFGVLSAWGFRYKQLLVWHKLGAAPFGGSVAPIDAEYLLVANHGSPPRLTKARSSVLSAAITKQHSRKPEAFLDLVEQVSPGPYLELFARRQRLGWDTWGNECFEHVEMEAAP